MAAVTHYDVLGVAPDARLPEIRRAYLRLAREHHPDAHASADQSTLADSRRRMQEINRAWAVLGDEPRRRSYDLELRRLEPVPEATPSFGARFDDRSSEEPWFGPPDLDDEGDAGEPPLSAHGLLTVGPVVLFATSVVLFCVGLVMGTVALLTVAVAVFLVSAGLFVTAPLVAMSASSRRDRR